MIRLAVIGADSSLIDAIGTRADAGIDHLAYVRDAADRSDLGAAGGRPCGPRR